MRNRDNKINTNPNKNLKISGDSSVESNAPIIVPGIVNNPSFNPNENSILFCLEYEIVDAIDLLSAANRLLLAATVGGNPKNVKAGTTIIPPPTPIIEPKTPAANPKRIIHN